MLAVGQVLNNRYRIIEPLGRGGMGSVFKGRDDTLNRFVAIKELRSDPGSSPQVRAQVQQQFLQEAQVLANMHHPCLPRVTDFFMAEGNEYLVMDFVDGQSLSSLQAQREGKPFEEAQVLGWARQLLDALAYCHARGVIHRDIKPHNLILTPDGRIVLVDFGLAKLVGPNQDQQTKAVLRGLGTPEYAPPEQYESTAGHTDPRSDIYAVGATLYHLLTGAPPPTAAQRMARPNIFVLPPTWHSAISPATQAAVLRALRIPQVERFGSVGDMQAALFPAGTSLYGLPVTAVPAPAASLAAPASSPSSPGTASGNTPLPMPDMRPSTPGVQALLAARPWTTYVMMALAGLMVALVGAGLYTGVGRVLSIALPPTPAATALAPPGTATLIRPATVAAPSAQPPTATSSRPAGPTDTPSASTTVRLRAPDGAVMVFVPSGPFTMGAEPDDAKADNNQKPAHAVVLSAFWIDRSEISNDQFLRFVEATGYIAESEQYGFATVWFKGQWSEQPGADWRHPYGPGTTIDATPDYPVVAVTWNDARAYCTWVGGRLPTEAEWEKAARGTRGYAWPWGTTWDATRVNYCDSDCPYEVDRDFTAHDGYALAAPIESFSLGASSYGALNMSGNVTEWVNDWYGSEYYSVSPAKDPRGPAGGDRRVARGGSWTAPQARVSPMYRGAWAPTTAFGNIGFRCAMNP
jgi:formylglycine-generating enzyme required for sulfatase activity/serine/threonine protein kinase